ncbi:MAG: VirB3 family type IV secretion system protein [Nitrospirota bacterium]|jgi:type IV secretion system protein VirB3|nr:VirB3 family type IV secretion system protein [Nitrospira sp.]NOS78532.1 type IV secretion system protein VirB3 [Nitrospira sp.]HRB17083.1 VirB3 family type IV secretion system protein [Nitrospira sp.]
MSDGFRDPIFKGCTRPAMLGGVPTLPLILICGLTLLLSVWSFYFVSGYVSLFMVLMAIPVVVTMREITKKDDQRLRQVMMRARMRLRHLASRATWGAISYGPLKFKMRRV